MIFQKFHKTGFHYPGVLFPFLEALFRQGLRVSVQIDEFKHLKQNSATILVAKAVRAK